MAGSIPAGSDMMTGNHMPAPKVLRLWDLLTADIRAKGAAGVK